MLQMHLLVESADLLECGQNLIGIIFIWFFTLTNIRANKNSPWPQHL